MPTGRSTGVRRRQRSEECYQPGGEVTIGRQGHANELGWRSFGWARSGGVHATPVYSGRNTRRPRRHSPSCPAAGSPRYVRPPWASGRAHDSATASDTTGHWPGHRPPPCWVPAYAPPVPHGRDDRYGTAGTRRASAPGRRPFRRAAGPGIRAESCRSGVRRRDARAARTAPS